MKIPFTGIILQSPFSKESGEVFAASPKKVSRGEGLPNRVVEADPLGDWYLTVPSKIPPRQVESMLRMALSGNLWQLHQLVCKMRDTWPEFRKVELELRSSVASVELVAHPYCLPNQEPTETAKEKADLVQRAIDSFKPDRFAEEEGQYGLSFDMTDSISLGVSISELIWDENATDPEGRPEKKIRASAWVHPRHYNFAADGSVGVAASEAAAENPAFPQQANSIPVLNNPSKFIVAKYKSKSGTCLGAGLARSLAVVWCAVTYGWDFMVAYSQKYGNPFLDIAYQAGIDQNEVNKFVAAAKQAVNSGFSVHPNTGTINAHPAQGMGGESAHVQLRRMADEFCQKIYLGQTLTSQTPTNGGSLAQGVVHQDVLAQKVEGLQKWLARIYTEQLAESLLIENYGESSERPTVLPDTTRPLTTQEQCTFLAAVSNSTLPLPKKEVYGKLALPIPEPGDEVLIRGTPVILEEAITPTEQKDKDFEQQVNQQVEVAKVQQELQGGAPEPGTAKASSVRATLGKASPVDLDHLDRLVTAAEAAPHRNGEMTALKSALDKIGGRHEDFF